MRTFRVIRFLHAALLCAGSLALLTACGSSSYSIDSGSGPPTGNGGGGTPGNPIGGGGPGGSGNSVVATPSIPGTINVVAGGERNVAIVFTSSDGRAISGFGISGSLGNLPPGWSGPSSFSCASVSTGSGCVLNLKFSPTGAASGTITLDYVFVDNSTMPKTGGSISIPYVATSHDNVVATASPAGQVDALIEGGSQSVTVTFTTDDGLAATNLSISSGLSTLPAGWTAASPAFSCAVVSTGSACGLNLNFVPSAAGSGTLALGFSYLDNSGESKTGTINVAYAGTTSNNVVGIVSPGGQVNAMAGAGTQPVTVTFVSDDGRPAAALKLNVDAASVPAGWSSGASVLSCATVSVGAGCRLDLTYAPTVAGSGTWSLPFTYVDQGGNARSGLVAIPYRATSGNNVVATPSVSAVGGPIGSSTSLTVTFTTDDGQPATNLSVGSDLSALPSGWSSGASSLSCATLSAGTGCQLALTFTSNVAASGTLFLSFAYVDGTGTPRTGTLAIPYAATPPVHLYLAQLVAGAGVTMCSLNPDGSLGTCTSTGGLGGGGRIDNTTGIAFNGDHAYVTDYANDRVYVCDVAAAGTLDGCTLTGGDFHSPVQLAVSGNKLYAADADPAFAVTTCSIQPDGTLAGCAAASGVGTFGIAANLSDSYLSVAATYVRACPIDGAGALQACADSGPGWTSPAGVTLFGGNVYITDTSAATVSACPVAADGSISQSCSAVSVGVSPLAIAFDGGRGYVVDSATNDLYVCVVQPANGSLANCTVDPSIMLTGAVQITAH